jgi:hypothetical protein
MYGNNIFLVSTCEHDSMVFFLLYFPTVLPTNVSCCRVECEIDHCYTAGQAVLEVAACADSAHEHYVRAAVKSDGDVSEQHLLFKEPIITTCLEPLDAHVLLDEKQPNVMPSKRLWGLYSSVHNDVFDLVGAKIKMQASGGVTPTADHTNSSQDKHSISNHDQRLLLCINRFNGLCICKDVKSLQAGQETSGTVSVS